MKHIKRFEIYWADLDPTKGSELRKTRPCIVVSPNEMNEVLHTVTIVPLTSTLIDWPFRCTITSTTQKSSAACDQLRTVAKERLRRKVGSLTSTERRSVMAILQAIFSE